VAKHTIGGWTINTDGRKRGTVKQGEFMGRFGGGWDYVLGFQASGFTKKRGGTIILNLLVTSWRITYTPKGARRG
jgi:hypothetical protein